MTKPLQISEILDRQTPRQATEHDLWCIRETLRRMQDNAHDQALRDERDLIEEIIQYAHLLEVRSRSAA